MTVIAEERQVSTLELFFDLVFVFAITQLTSVLADDPTPLSALRVLLVFGVLWWMFGGYVWLTNAVAPDRPVRKLLLLLAMGGFLVIALAIPTAFEGGGIVFGLGYLLVVLIHGGLFVSTLKSARLQGIVRVAPLNVTAALVLVAAGFTREPSVYVLWFVAFGTMVLTSFLADPGGFRVAPGHFVERHGLLLIIVLGESIVAISVGAADLPLDASLLIAGTLSLAVVSCLWWLYFNEDDTHAEDAMSAAPPERRMRMALNAFFYAQIPMLLGIVAFAAGVKSAIGHAFEPLPAYAALFLASGVALYLVGDALFRIGIGFRHANTRFVAAVAALATFPIGLVNASLQLVALLVVLLVAILGLPRARTLDARVVR
jgi:low temperature requirement protein LtrA